MTVQKAALLIFIVLCIGTGQILFKQASKALAGGGSLLALAGNPAFLAALAIYGASTVMWIWAIRDVPLNRAYCFVALTFVFVPVLASVFLHEALNWKVFAGAAIIGAGILVAQL